MIQTNKIIKKNIEHVDKNMPDTRNYFKIKEFNRLTHLHFIFRMVEATKNLLLNIKWKVHLICETKIWKNKNKRNQAFDLSYFTRKSNFDDDGHKLI